MSDCRMQQTGRRQKNAEAGLEAPSLLAFPWVSYAGAKVLDEMIRVLPDSYSCVDLCFMSQVFRKAINHLCNTLGAKDPRTSEWYF